jgi:hypothetical protein
VEWEQLTPVRLRGQLFPVGTFFGGRSRTDPSPSRALLRGDGGEGGPALFNFLATAVRTQNFALFVVDQ